MSTASQRLLSSALLSGEDRIEGRGYRGAERGRGDRGQTKRAGADRSCSELTARWEGLKLRRGPSPCSSARTRTVRDATRCALSLAGVGRMWPQSAAGACGQGTSVSRLLSVRPHTADLPHQRGPTCMLAITMFSSAGRDSLLDPQLTSTMHCDVLGVPSLSCPPGCQSCPKSIAGRCAQLLQNYL